MVYRQPDHYSTAIASLPSFALVGGQLRGWPPDLSPYGFYEADHVAGSNL